MNKSLTKIVAGGLMFTSSLFGVLKANSLENEIYASSQNSVYSQVAEESSESEDEKKSFWEVMADTPMLSGLNVYSFNYEEPGFMEETGMFFGFKHVYGGLVHLKNQEADIFTKLFLGQSWASVDYEGMTMDGSPLELEGSKDRSSEFRWLFGLGNQEVVFYTGIGFRDWKNDLSEHDAGYKRVSNYLYTPVGSQIDLNLGGDWSIKAIGEYDFFWRGRQESYLSKFDIWPQEDEDGARSFYVENIQNEGRGFRASIRFSRPSTVVFENSFLVIEPFIRYWHIEDSEVATAELEVGREYYPIEFIEPENETFERGVFIGLSNRANF